jgi:DNA (cytosine-5)-methyltransferase 1
MQKEFEKDIERILHLTYLDNNKENSNTGNTNRVLNRIGKNSFNPDSEQLLSDLENLSVTHCFETNPDCDNCPINMFCNLWRESCEEKSKRNNSIPFIDLFCGAGGLSLGLEQYNFTPIFALDFNTTASQTYLFNRPFMRESNFHNGDITDFQENNSIPKAPIIIGGPPCQGFSNANRQRLSDDPRNHLYKDFINWVQKSEAKVCIVENVPGMLKVQDQVERDFSSIGFIIKPLTLNTKDLGYPQNRNRVFWFGLKTEDILFFEHLFNLFSDYVLETQFTNRNFVLEDAIGDLPKLEAKTQKNSTHVENDKWGYSIAKKITFDSPYAQLINGGKFNSFLLNHRTKYNNDRDIEIYRRLKPGEKSDAESIQDIMPYKNRSDIFKDKYFKLEPDKVSKTITAHMYYDCHMYIHPYQARGLTPREAARIQGFPDDYYFLGTPNEWYRQIGNAVSPLAARHIGYALSKILEEYGTDLL